MSSEYWKKQGTEPLYPDIIWSRPQSRSGAGKLTIIGGNSHGFSAPGIAYNKALQSGIGVCHVVLPDAIKKLVKGILPDADYAPSTPSGSFAKQSLDDLLRLSAWGDGVLLAGDLGRNSETAILLEQFVSKYQGMLTITHDAVDYFKETPTQIVDRDKTLIVLSLAQLQKLFIATPSIIPITYSMTTQQLVDALHDYSQPHQAGVVVKHNDLLFIAKDGEVITSKFSSDIWRVETATKASIFWLQNPEKILESTVSSLINEESNYE